MEIKKNYFVTKKTCVNNFLKCLLKLSNAKKKTCEKVYYYYCIIYVHDMDEIKVPIEEFKIKKMTLKTDSIESPLSPHELRY